MIVYSGDVDDFVLSISGRKLTQKETEIACTLYRGCGALRRYIALALTKGYKGQSATDHDRRAMELLCREGLHCDLDYALQQAKHAQIEIEVFGPLVKDKDRMSKSLPTEHARQLARLPEGERKATYDHVLEFHKEDGGTITKSSEFRTNLTHYVNQRLKELFPDKIAAKKNGKGTKPVSPTDPDTKTRIDDEVNERARELMSGKYATPDAPQTDEDTPDYNEAAEEEWEGDVRIIRVSAEVWDALKVIAEEAEAESVEDCISKWALGLAKKILAQREEAVPV